MLRKFQYVRPKTIHEAISSLSSSPKAMVLAGGTDLLVQIRGGLAKPEILVDVKGLPELKDIREDSKDIFLGSVATFWEISDSRLLNEHFPSLIQACNAVGSPQIRNMATIGGNAQTASPAGDGLTALYGLGATVGLLSSSGERRVPLCEFVRGPKQTQKRQDEIIAGFFLPKRRWDFQEFFKIGKRKALAISVVNGFIGIGLDSNGAIRDAVIVLGAVAPTPIRLGPVEERLVGRIHNEELGKEVRRAVRECVSPISDMRAGKEYRAYIAGVMCDRIIGKVTGGIAR